MIITAIRPAKGHRVTLIFSDGTDVSIDKTTWEESPYGVGSSLSCQEAEALCADSERRRAESKAVFLLSKRDLSRRELEQKLCREKGRYRPESREAAAAAAEKMEELGYVDDEAYAHRLAERMAKEKLYPARRITEELIRKGIGKELAKEAAECLGLDETEMALAFLAKKRYTVPQNAKDAQRIAAALARFGYGSDVVRRAMRQWGEELPDE
jgi:regulatory protein